MISIPSLGQSSEDAVPAVEHPAQESPAPAKTNADERQPQDPPAQSQAIKKEEASKGGEAREKPEEYYQKEDLEAQRAMARATDDLVSLSQLQIILTGVATALLIWTLIYTRKATNTAHKEFMATHRPRLRLRFIEIDSLNVNKQSRATITFANVGETDATVIAFGGKMAYRIEAGIPRQPVVAVDPPDIIKSGARHTYKVKTIGTLDEHLLLWLEMGRQEMYVVGEIQYRDALGIIRHTGFLRTYDYKLERFNKPDGEELEYED